MTEQNGVRAIVFVAYYNAPVPDEALRAVQTAMIDVLDSAEELDLDQFQMAETRIIKLDADEYVSFYVDDLEDLDEEDARDMDDFREPQGYR